MYKIQVENIYNQDFFNNELLTKIYKEKEKAEKDLELIRKLLKLSDSEIKVVEVIKGGPRT